ncbi:MAG: hypothetical protein JNL75_11195 [Chitinophagales bacterium]|nr:hypothetical protein [Chitinophagales bacterium]
MLKTILDFVTQIIPSVFAFLSKNKEKKNNQTLVVLSAIQAASYLSQGFTVTLLGTSMTFSYQQGLVDRKINGVSILNLKKITLLEFQSTYSQSYFTINK